MSKLEHINCPICECDETELLFVKDDLSVVACKQCKLRYVNPRINRLTLEKGYVETYYPPEKVERIHADDMEWLQMSERLIELERQHQGKGRILDVGCGIGTFLNLASEQGWESYGIDPSKSGCTFAQQEYKLDVRCGDIFDAKFPSAHFDVITLYHVLEHISELNPFLSELHRILKPSEKEEKESTLVIEVPNGEGLQSRIHKADWPYVHPQDHLYYFSSHSLPILLQKHGFRNIRLGKPRRVSQDKDFKFKLRQVATSMLVRLHLGTVIRVYASL